MPRLLLLALLTLGLATLPGCGDDPASAGESGGATPVAKGPAPAMAGTSGLTAEGAAKVAEAMDRGAAYLRGTRDENGGWGDAEIKIPANVGYTGMAVLGLIAATPKTEVRTKAEIVEGLRFLAGFQQENGAIFDNPQYVNYYSSVSAGAFAMARIPEFAKAQAKARDYLAASQISGDETDPSYGGFPYKQESHGQSADLSNAQIAAQALHDAGLPADHPAWERMRSYLARVQNDSESNDMPTELEVDGAKRKVVPGDDGGAYYRPGESKAGMVKRSDGTWEFKSYGSMSYALLKCLLFAGVPVGDRRVEMVVKWIQDHWTVERNPGFEAADDPEKASQQGYFYYLYTAGRALADYERRTGKPLVIRDREGRKHDWRREMAAKLISMQEEDGSWRNERAARWEEGSKVLATGYALQTLGYLTNRLP